MNGLNNLQKAIEMVEECTKEVQSNIRMIGSTLGIPADVIENDIISHDGEIDIDKYREKTKNIIENIRNNIAPN